MAGDDRGIPGRVDAPETPFPGPRAFVWPPVPSVTGETPPPPPSQLTVETPAIAPRPAGLVREWLRETESFWLAPVALPLERRIAETGWIADDFDLFCNRCGGDVGPSEEDEFGCARCRDWPRAWDRFVRLGAYEGDLASWVKEVKFTRNAALGVGLGRALAGRLVDAGLPGPGVGEGVCVVPVGMSWRRRWARGIDHAAVVGEGVAKGLEAPLVRALRRFHRESQRRQESRTARETNAKGSFALRKGVDLSGWTVVLVDDVSTTGATLRAASRALRARRPQGRPMSIWAATVGVTRDRQARG